MFQSKVLVLPPRRVGLDGGTERVLVSFCCSDKTLDKNQLKGGRVVWLLVRTEPIISGKLGRNSRRQHHPRSIAEGDGGMGDSCLLLIFS